MIIEIILNTAQLAAVIYLGYIFLGRVDKMEAGLSALLRSLETLQLIQRPPTHTKINQVLRREGDRLVHHSWVRRDSIAWKKAYDKPGLYIKDVDDNIEEGVQ